MARINSPDLAYSWRPTADLEPFNRALVALEQVYLAVLRKSRDAAALLSSPEFADLLAQVDENPHQAVAMARIKSGHTMTPRHGINVMMTARAWVVSKHKLGARLEPFTQAALLHDFGHWRPDDLLFVFDFFSRDEFQRMKNHAADGAGALPLGEEAQSWIAQHHEQVDGKGYPLGIHDPHPLAQILRICDCFDGLTTPRRFRPAASAHRAMMQMSRWSGYKYSAGLFQSFLEFMGGAHPAGCLVRLLDGSMGLCLPPKAAQLHVLPVTNAQGDPLSNGEPRLLEIAEIKDEAMQWQQVTLPEIWRNLRPDLLHLSRFY